MMDSMIRFDSIQSFGSILLVRSSAPRARAANWGGGVRCCSAAAWGGQEGRRANMLLRVLLAKCYMYVLRSSSSYF